MSEKKEYHPIINHADKDPERALEALRADLEAKLPALLNDHRKITDACRLLVQTALDAEIHQLTVRPITPDSLRMQIENRPLANVQLDGNTSAKSVAQLWQDMGQITKGTEISMNAEGGGIASIPLRSGPLDARTIRVEYTADPLSLKIQKITASS